MNLIAARISKFMTVELDGEWLNIIDSRDGYEIFIRPGEWALLVEFAEANGFGKETNDGIGET